MANMLAVLNACKIQKKLRVAAAYFWRLYCCCLPLCADTHFGAALGKMLFLSFSACFLLVGILTGLHQMAGARIGGRKRAVIDQDMKEEKQKSKVMDNFEYRTLELDVMM